MHVVSFEFRLETKKNLSYWLTPADSQTLILCQIIIKFCCSLVFYSSYYVIGLSMRKIFTKINESSWLKKIKIKLGSYIIQLHLHKFIVEFLLQG